MAVWNPKPLSWGERMELAQSLRKEAAEKIAEAQRIEDGLSADQDAVYAAVEAARARIEAKKVGAGDTAHVCGLQGFGQAGDECPACVRPNVEGHRLETAGGRHGSGGPTGSASDRRET